MIKQVQFLCRIVDQMVVMCLNSVRNPLVSAGVLTKMATSSLEQTSVEERLVHLSLVRQNAKKMLVGSNQHMVHCHQPVIALVDTPPCSVIILQTAVGV